MFSLRERTRAVYRRVRAGRWARLIEAVLALWSQHAVPRHAAALAFYTLLSLAPMVLALTGVAGYWLGKQRVSEQLIAWVERTVGGTAAQPLRHLIEQTVLQGSGAGATIVGLLLALWGASGLLHAVKASLDEFWESSPNHAPVKGWLLSRLVAAGAVLLMTLLLVVSMVMEVALHALRAYGDSWWLLYPLLVWGSRGLVPALMVFGFALFYWLLPSVKPRWRDTFWGAVVAVALWMVGRTLVSLYVAHSGLATLYGSAGALVVLLLWVYVSAMIFFLGALVSVALTRLRA
jgi:membrane protein